MNAPQSRGRTPRLRFSLRMLLIVTGVLGVFLGWLGNVCIHTRHQRQVVARIRAAGGECGLANLLSDDDAAMWQKLLRWVVDDDAFAHVVGVYFDPYTVVSDDELDVLTEVPRLQVLELCGPRITDKGLAHIGNLSQIKRLTLYETQVTTTGLSAFPIGKNLEELYLGGGTVNDASLKDINRLTNLRLLAIHRSSAITDASMTHLANHGRLKVLEVFKTSITDKGLVNLRSLPQLRELTLNSTLISDTGLRQLAELPRLKRLSLQDTPIGDAGLAELSRLHGVEELNLLSTTITDSGMLHLAKLRELRRLNLLQTAVTDAGLRDLGTLNKLEWLSVGPNVTFDGANELRRSLPKRCRVDVLTSTNGIQSFGRLDNEN
jgi:hypothetical protein